VELAQWLLYVLCAVATVASSRLLPTDVANMSLSRLQLDWLAERVWSDRRVTCCWSPCHSHVSRVHAVQRWRQGVCVCCSLSTVYQHWTTTSSVQRLLP